MSNPYTRMVGDREVPLPGTYVIDPVHSGVGFQVHYLGLTKVRGRFNDFEGTITVAEEPADSTVQVMIRSTSIDTAQPRRDQHLRSHDFLAAPDHPTLEFVSTGLDGDSDAFQLAGNLTIRGKTCPVALSARFHTAVPDLVGDARQPRVGFSACTVINRDDFGITFNQALTTGGWLIGKQVHVQLDVQAARC